MPDFIARPLAAAQAVGKIPAGSCQMRTSRRESGRDCAIRESSSNMVNKPLTNGFVGELPVTGLNGFCC